MTCYVYSRLCYSWYVCLQENASRTARINLYLMHTLVSVMLTYIATAIATVIMYTITIHQKLYHYSSLQRTRFVSQKGVLPLLMFLNYASAYPCCQVLRISSTLLPKFVSCSKNSKISFCTVT